MARIKANALRPGDAIGLIAPASPPRSQDRIEKSVQYFERLGYRVEMGKHLMDSPGYLAAPDKDRLADLHAMFRMKRVKAIFFIRGGFGSIRLLDRIDYDLIRNNPKIIVGYSDATALFAAIHKQTGLSSCFFGPMPGVDLWDDVNHFTEEHFWRVVTSSKPIGELPLGAGEGKLLVRGKSKEVQGTMLGGNLTVFSSLLGTPYQPSFRNAMPLFEEIEEKPRKIDAYFAQLRLAGLWKNAKAILLGQFTNCNTDADSPTRTLDGIFEDYFGKLGVPVISNLPFGHEPRLWTLPLVARIDLKIMGDRPIISIPDAPLL
jgi:muramoyltetrapeptide carboxypeptidase